MRNIQIPAAVYDSVSLFSGLSKSGTTPGGGGATGKSRESTVVSVDMMSDKKKLFADIHRKCINGNVQINE